MREQDRPTRVSRRAALSLLALGTAGAAAVGTTAANQHSDSLIGPELIEADEEAGFNFPYYLYAPTDARDKPLLVEPVNSGGCDDDFQVDLEFADRLVSLGQPREISDGLRVPLIVPVLGNPCEEPFFDRFIQSLDTETMRIDSGEYERIDLQVLRMVDDARDRLAAHDVEVPESIMLSGFSATGNFANNFTMLHPDRVASVAAGAINGMATLPRETAFGETLNYQIGVADVAELTGEPFDEATWRAVPQFYYMGSEETPPLDDTLPYRDVWSEEQAQKARRVYGDDMQSERMVYSEAVYQQADATARFEVYDGIGHTFTDQVTEEIIAFHRRHNDIGSDDPQVAQTGSLGEEAGPFTVSSCGDEQTTDGVAVGFAQRPTPGAETVHVELDIDAEFEQRVRVRLFPETAGGRFGEGLDRVAPGTTDTRTYEIPAQFLTAGETVEVRAFPTDWRNLDDVLTTACTIVSGVQFDGAVLAGNSTVTVEYVHPPTAADPGTLELVVDGTAVTLVDEIAPGSGDRRTFDVDPLPDDAEVSVQLVTAAGDHIDTDTVTTWPEDHGTVGFAAAPEPDEQSLSLAYDLTADHQTDRFCTLRLYNSMSSSWGILLEQVEPGESGSTTVELSLDEPGVPFAEGEELEIALVEWDDPYATDPIAVATGTVGDSVEETEVPDSDDTTEDDGDDDETDDDDTAAGDDEPADDDPADDSPDADDEPTETDAGTPGFGVGSALTSLGAVGYLLKRRLEDSSEE